MRCFLPRCPRHSGPSTVPIIAPGLRANIKSTGREVRRVLPGDRDAFKQAADGGGEESGKFRPRGGFRSVFILKQQTPLQFLFSALALSGMKSNAQWRVCHVTPAAPSTQTGDEYGQRPRLKRYRLSVDTQDCMDNASAGAGDDGCRTRAIDPELVRSPRSLAQRLLQTPLLHFHFWRNTSRKHRRNH